MYTTGGSGRAFEVVLQQLSSLIRSEWTQDEEAWAPNGKKYTPGFVGMNNVKVKDLLQRHHTGALARRAPPQLLPAGGLLDASRASETIKHADAKDSEF